MRRQRALVTGTDDRRQQARTRLEARPEWIDLHNRVEDLRAGLADERTDVRLARTELAIQWARHRAPRELELGILGIGTRTRLVGLREGDVGSSLVRSRVGSRQIRRDLVPALLADRAAVDQSLVALERRLGEHESGLRTLGLRARSLLLRNRLLHAGVGGIQLDPVLRWIDLVEHVARPHERTIGNWLRLQPPCGAG